MEKNTFKKVLVLVFAVLMCAMSVICVSASPESYATGRTYTYNSTEYVADRPADATVITHVYYVGGDNGSDTNDGSTKETPFATITGAIAYAQSKGYLLDVDYATTELHEVKIILLGDTVETPTDTKINGKDDSGCFNIQGGILTIVPDDGVNATVTIGTSTKTVKKNFFYMRPASRNTGKYIELNLGAPNMNGTITFDGTYYDISENYGSNYYWGAFLRIGDESYTDVAVANMYDGVTIANIGYNEDTKAIVDTTSNGFVVQADCGTFNMYGGTITQNVCRSAIASYGRAGLGAYVYGGKITNNNSRVLYTGWDANAKIVVYDCLIQNNSSDAWGAIETSKERSTIILYGGKLLNNIGAGKDNNKAVNAQVYSGGYIYVSDKVAIENGECVSLDGNVYTIEKTYFVKNNTYKPLDMKSTVIYAKDGSAIGYGYVPSKQASGYYLKDRNKETTETLTLEKVAGYQLYTQAGTTSCAYAIPDDDAIYTGITPSADMTSAVYYYNSEKVHRETYSIVTPATTTDNGLGRYTCQDCGATRDVIIPASDHVHNYIETVIPPTCTEYGYTEHKCSGCEDSYRTDIVDALGHDYSGAGTVVTPPTCLERGYTTYTCQREGCGYSYVGTYVSSLGHDYVENVIVAPTASSTGINLYTCSRCDNFSQERVTYLAPTDIDVKVTVDVSGVRTELTVKMSDIYNYDRTAPSATADYALALNGIKEFTVDGTKYTKANVVEISIPFGVLTVNNSGNLFNNNKVIEKVDFSTSDGVTIIGNAFQNSTVKDVVFGNNMTINGSAFNNCDALTKIVVGDGLTINFKGEWVFNGCDNILSAEFGASNITFGKNSFRTTSDNSKYTPLNLVKFSDGGNYIFGEKAFARTNVTEIILPDGATVSLLSTSINSTDAFWECDFLTYAYVGEGTLDVAKMFDDCKGLEKVILVGPEKIGTYGFCDYNGRSDKTLKVYIHKSDVDFGDNAFYKRSGIQVYTMAPITKANVFNSCSTYTIYYGIAHEYTEHTFAPTCTEEGYDGYITSCPHCGENIEPEYSSIYQIFENTLVGGTTSFFEQTNIVAPAGHTAGDVIRIVYENGFDSIGSYKRVCSVCNDNYYAEDADAIFMALGYSAKNNNTSLYAGFVVNVDALNAYNSYLESGKELKYGIIVSNVTGKDALTVADGSVDTNSVMAEISDHTLNRIGISVNRLDPKVANHVNLQIVISAYVIDENGDMSFVQKDGATDGGYYTSGMTVNGTENALGIMTLKQVAYLSNGVVLEPVVTNKEETI